MSRPTLRRRLVTPATAVALALAAVTLVAAAGPSHADADLAVTESSVDAYPRVDLTLTVPAALDDDLPGALVVREDNRVRDARVRPLSGDELDVVVLVDVSGSMAGAPLDAARRAADGFVERMPEGVQVAVTSFASDVATHSGFSADHDRARSALAGLRVGEQTSLFDGVDAALDQLAAEDGAHQVVVLLADGDDNDSAASAEAVASRLAGEGVALHTIMLESASADFAALTRLAETSGGQALATPQPSELAGLYDEVAEVLERTYLVDYASGAHGYTPVTVTVGDQTADAVVALPPTLLDRLAQALGNWTPAFAGGLVFAGVCGALLMGLRPEPTVRLSRLRKPDTVDRVPGLKGLTAGLMGVADRQLRRRGAADGLAAALERAGANLRPGEYVVFTGSLGLAVAAVLTLVGLWPLAVLVLVGTPFIARAVLRVLARRRSEAFAELLPDTLQMLAGSLRAGYGMLQAVDAVAHEADEPVASEFRRVLVETRLGRDIDDALEAMSHRVDVADLDWVVQALAIHRDVGGDLAEVLDSIGETVRDRDRIKREVRSLSAEGRLSAYVLVALPVVVGLAMSAISPGYLTPLVTTPIGWALVATAGVLLAIGTVLIMRIVRPVY